MPFGRQAFDAKQMSDIDHPKRNKKTCAYLALREQNEGLVRENDGDIGLGLRVALVDGTSLLEVDRPDSLLALLVLDTELEDTVGLQKGT